MLVSFLEIGILGADGFSEMISMLEASSARTVPIGFAGKVGSLLVLTLDVVVRSMQCLGSPPVTAEYFDRLESVASNIGLADLRFMGTPTSESDTGVILGEAKE